jgi:hypothetical protein
LLWASVKLLRSLAKTHREALHKSALVMLGEINGAGLLPLTDPCVAAPEERVNRTKDAEIRVKRRKWR